MKKQPAVACGPSSYSTHYRYSVVCRRAWREHLLRNAERFRFIPHWWRMRGWLFLYPIVVFMLRRCIYAVPVFRFVLFLWDGLFVDVHAH